MYHFEKNKNKNSIIEYLYNPFDPGASIDVF